MGDVTPLQRTEQVERSSDVTRYLCSSVFLGRDAAIREKLRVHASDKYHYIADNKGLNTRLVARVLDFFDQQKLRHIAWHGPLGVLCFSVVAVLILAGSDETQLGGMLAAVVLICAFGIPLYRRTLRNRYEYPLHHFSEKQFREEQAMQTFSNSRNKVEDQIAVPEADPNVSVYQGFTPFVGAGGSLGDWSLLIDTRKGKDGGSPEKFSAQELERAIGAAFRQLALPNMRQGERLFVHGEDVSAVEGLLPERFGRPRQNISDETLAHFRHSDSRQARIYQFVEVSDWAEQVCISFFYRATFRGPMLYLEIHSRMLQPIALEYREVDQLVEPTFSKKFGLFAGLAIVAPFVCAWECLELFGILGRGREQRQLEKAQEHQIEERQKFNYGAERSLRESVASSIYDHFFEKSDRDLWVKAVQKQLFDSVIDFLEHRNVDTSELRDQRNLIVNSGLIVHGDVQAGALAVGNKAKAHGGGEKSQGGAKAAAGAGA